MLTFYDALACEYDVRGSRFFKASGKQCKFELDQESRRIDDVVVSEQWLECR